MIILLIRLLLVTLLLLLLLLFQYYKLTSPLPPQQQISKPTPLWKWIFHVMTIFPNTMIRNIIRQHKWHLYCFCMWRHTQFCIYLLWETMTPVLFHDVKVKCRPFWKMAAKGDRGHISRGPYPWLYRIHLSKCVPFLVLLWKSEQLVCYAAALGS